LIYAGDKDFICNWLGNEAWSNVLPWSETEGFSSAKTKSWKVDGEEAGTVKNHKNFSFLRIYEAGHMVPYDQPENSLDFFNEWIGSNFGIRH
jgi:cathepsin A (carboxypeptidase C)